MSESILFRVPRDKTQAIKETVESWKLLHDEAMLAFEAEEMVRECLTIPEDLRQLWESVVARAGAGKIEDFEAEEKRLRVLFDECVLPALELARGHVHGLARSSGHGISGVDEIGPVIAAVKSLRDKILEHWPRYDAAMVEKAWAAYLAGQSRPAKEIYDELRRSRA
jgi:hypothetical protein